MKNLLKINFEKQHTEKQLDHRKLSRTHENVIINRNGMEIKRTTYRPMIETKTKTATDDANDFGNFPLVHTHKESMKRTCELLCLCLCTFFLSFGVFIFFISYDWCVCYFSTAGM